MTPVRAIGLAVELAWKLALGNGFQQVDECSLASIHISGDVKVNNRNVEGADVDLRKADSGSALAIYQETCKLLLLLGFMATAVDVRVPRRRWCHDLVGSFADFTGSTVKALVSVELKVCSLQNWTVRLKETKELLESRFQQMSHKFDAVLLVMCKVGKTSTAVWQALQLEALLWDGKAWSKLKAVSVSTAPQRTGLVLPNAVSRLVDGLPWHGRRPKVARIVDFLSKLRRNRDNATQRALVWNGFLKSSLHFYKKKLPLYPGSEPWVGKREAFLQVCHYMKRRDQLRL